MHKIFCYLIIFLFINLEYLTAATVGSVTQLDVMDFGSFAAINTTTGGGTIKTSGVTTGSVKAFSGFNIGNFAVVASRSGGSNNRLTFNVVIPSSASVTRTGGAMNLSLSLDPNFTVTSKQFNLPNNISGNQTLTVPLYGTLTVSGSQTVGTYSGSFIFRACNCNNSGCQSTC